MHDHDTRGCFGRQPHAYLEAHYDQENWQYPAHQLRFYDRISSMFTTLIAAALMLAGQQAETAIITGAVVAPPEQSVSQPVQVILLPPRYVQVWNSEVQKRLDTYCSN